VVGTKPQHRLTQIHLNEETGWVLLWYRIFRVLRHYRLPRLRWQLQRIDGGRSGAELGVDLGDERTHDAALEAHVNDDCGGPHATRSGSPGMVSWALALVSASGNGRPTPLTSRVSDSAGVTTTSASETDTSNDVGMRPVCRRTRLLEAGLRVVASVSRTSTSGAL
jgi:hypothetical protein